MFLFEGMSDNWLEYISGYLDFVSRSMKEPKYIYLTWRLVTATTSYQRCIPRFLGTWTHTTISIVKRFEEVNINITSLISKFQTVLVTVQNFKDGIDSMAKWCEQTKKMFERLTAVSFDIYILQQQIREIKVCVRLACCECFAVLIVLSVLNGNW